MTEFNWTVDDIKRAQRDFSNNFMRLDCIRTESYDVAIDCMTECIEKKAADVQPVKRGKWNTHDVVKVLCSGETLDGFCQCTACGDVFPLHYSEYNYCPNCGARMTDEGR